MRHFCFFSMLFIFWGLTTGCNDSWGSNWQGKWKINRDELVVDLGRCSSACNDLLFSVPLEINVSVEPNQIRGDYISASLNCGKKCRDVSGIFDQRYFEVENKAFVSLFGNLTVQGSNCLLFGTARLDLGKTSSSRLNFQLLGSAADRINKTRCQISLFGSAKRK